MTNFAVDAKNKGTKASNGSAQQIQNTLTVPELPAHHFRPQNIPLYLEPCSPNNLVEPLAQKIARPSRDELGAPPHLAATRGRRITRRRSCIRDTGGIAEWVLHVIERQNAIGRVIAVIVDKILGHAAARAAAVFEDGVRERADLGQGEGAALWVETYSVCVRSKNILTLWTTRQVRFEKFFSEPEERREDIGLTDTTSVDGQVTTEAEASRDAVVVAASFRRDGEGFRLADADDVIAVIVERRVVDLSRPDGVAQDLDNLARAAAQ